MKSYTPKSNVLAFAPKRIAVNILASTSSQHTAYNKHLSSFQDIPDLKVHLESTDSEIITKMEVPCFLRANSSRRITGFWSYKWVQLVWGGLRGFLERGGRFQHLIGGLAGDNKTRECLESFAKGTSEYANQCFQIALEGLAHSLDDNVVDLFHAMGTSKQCEIRLQPRLHDKLWIWGNEIGEEVFVHGSGNDTQEGHTAGRDSFTTLYSWSSDEMVRQSVLDKIAWFESAWKSEKTFELSEQSLDLLKKLSSGSSSVGHLHPLVKERRNVEKQVMEWAKTRPKKKVLLVEGVTDKKYIEHVRDLVLAKESRDLFQDVEVIPLHGVKITPKIAYWQRLLFENQIETFLLVDGDDAGIKAKTDFAVFNRHLIDQMTRMDRPGLFEISLKCEAKKLDEFKEARGADLNVDVADRTGLVIEDFLEDGFVKTICKTELMTTCKNKLAKGFVELKKTDECPRMVKLFRLLASWINGFEIDEESSPQLYVPKYEIALHQREALGCWRRNNWRGVLEHATGTYKTATGLFAIRGMLSEVKLVVVVTPLIDIATQWATAIREGFDLEQVSVLECWGGSDRAGWPGSLRALAKSDSPTIAVFVSNSLRGAKGKSFFSSVDIPWGLICDECHRWANAKGIKFLEAFRPVKTLGLSGSIQKKIHHRSEMERRLLLLLGGVIHEYSIHQAIEAGILSEYRYQLKIIHASMGTLSGLHDSSESGQIRKQIRESWEREKLSCAASEICTILKEYNRVLVYCRSRKDADFVADNVNSISGQFIAKAYHSGVSTSKREVFRKDFESGIFTQVLTSVRCLDEGVDIPVCDAALFLDSSKEDSRQWIQRRGRVLRVSDPQKTAFILDFIVVPPRVGEDEELKRRLWDYVESEVKRMEAFGIASKNPGEVAKVLHEVNRMKL